GIIAQLAVDIRELRIETGPSEIGGHHRKLLHEVDDIVMFDGGELGVRIRRRCRRRWLLRARRQPQERQRKTEPSSAHGYFLTLAARPGAGRAAGRVCWNEGRRSRRSNQS